MKSSTGVNRPVFVMAALVVLALIAWGIQSSQEPVPADAAVVTGHPQDRPAVESSEISTRNAVPDRAVVGEASCAILEVVDEFGKPIEGAVARRTAAVTWYEASGGQTVGSSDVMPASNSSGIIRLSQEDLGDDVSIFVWKSGFEPGFVGVLEPGATRRVAMSATAEASILVVREDGRPVPGYRVHVARAAPATQEVPPSRSPLLRLREARYGGSIFTGTSDAGGKILIAGLARGAYFIRPNQDMIPFSSFGYPIKVDIPGSPITIVVREYWASVIEYVGDPVVIANRPNLGQQALFGIASSRLEYMAMRKATNELESRYPGAQVLVGLPTRDVAAQGRGSLQVFSRTHGWHEHDVEVFPISSWAKPQVVSIPFGDDDQTAEFTAVAVDAESNPLDLPDAGVFVEYDSGAVYFVGRMIVFGEKARLPAGSCKVYPGGRLARTLEPFTIDLKAGSDVELPIDLSRVRAYRLSLRLPDGSLALRWGARIEDERGNSHYPSPTPTLLIYSNESHLNVTAYVQGYRSRKSRCDHHPLDEQHGIVQEFELNAGELLGGSK